MNEPALRRRSALRRKTLAVFAVLAFTVPAMATSVLSLGPRAIQALVARQLFSRAGRWYLIDDGGICYTYLESPRVHVENDRLVLNAHLSSRLGQRMGASCVGADFASNVTLSGRLRSSERTLILDDIRIERVEDESTRNALNLALQLAPDALPRSLTIDVLDLVRKQVAGTDALPVHFEQFRIVRISTRTDTVTIQFDLDLSTP